MNADLLQSSNNDSSDRSGKSTGKARKVVARARRKDPSTEEREYFKDVFQYMSKAANYLLLAHGAAFIGCVNALKDFKDTQFLKGVGIFIMLFAVGFVIASIGFATILIMQNSVMAELIEGHPPSRQTKILMTTTPVAFFLSWALLMIGILGIAARLISL